MISTVGSKWKPAKVFGPDAQPKRVVEQSSGKISMLINWNKSDSQAERIDIEIE
ncbi:hypothetical protein [Algibacillus agarilyticus]|uniref:hypothetical protein n=1 Tax=Algibacillus agarilyticus TaxID=2234133 RepID=UPI0013008D0B|nr:hypothetical protein [Algibacillus agarilyticus]